MSDSGHLASGRVGALRGGRSRSLSALDSVPRRAPRLLRGVFDGALAALVRVRGALLGLRIAGLLCLHQLKWLF